MSDKKDWATKDWATKDWPILAAELVWQELRARLGPQWGLCDIVRQTNMKMAIADIVRDVAEKAAPSRQTMDDYDRAYGRLRNLLAAVAPQCTPSSILCGLVDQIDNYIAGLRAESSGETMGQ